jgi:hypothetical protein
MNCPNCSKELVAGAQDCESCGIVLAKWKPREYQANLAASPLPAMASGMNIRWAFLSLVALAIGGFYGYRQRNPSWTMPEELKPLLITHEDFGAKVLQASKPVLVLFSDHLGLSPTFAQVQRDCSDRVLAFVVDLESEPQLGSTYQIRDETDSRRGTHNLVLFDQGREVKRTDPFDIANSIMNSRADIRDHLLKHDPPETWRDSYAAAFAAEMGNFAGCR